MSEHENLADELVAVSVTRNIKPGREKEYEAWITRVSKVAAKFEGYMGANVIRPPIGHLQYTTIYRFNNHTNAAAWQISDEHAKEIEAVSHLIEGDTTRRQMTGLEVWFDSTAPINNAPTKWKMALILFCVVYVLINTFTVLLEPFINHLPRSIQLFIIVFIQIVLMTYYLMPKINALFSRWLFK